MDGAGGSGAWGVGPDGLWIALGVAWRGAEDWFVVVDMGDVRAFSMTAAVKQVLGR